MKLDAPAQEFESEVEEIYHIFTNVIKVIPDRKVAKVIKKKFKSQCLSAEKIAGYLEGVEIDNDDLYMEGYKVLETFRNEFLKFADTVCHSLLMLSNDPKICSMRFGEGDQILVRTKQRLLNFQVRFEMT